MFLQVIKNEAFSQALLWFSKIKKIDKLALL
jgi:hypothetical protein